MNNQLLARGKMFGLAFKTISRADFIELMKSGRSGKLYEDLKQANNNENGHYGFYQWEGKPSFELYLNEASLGLKKAYKTQYEIKSLPVNGSSGKVKGAEQFFYVKEKGFKNGNSHLEFDEEFDPRELRFEVYRQGMFNGTVCSTISPTYKNQSFELMWNWSGYSSDYIITSKGKCYDLENEKREIKSA
jgi:hypothetical protein